MSPIHRETGETTAIGRAAELLRQFRTSRGALSAAALVRRTGLPKTTVYRMVDEMVRIGLLEREGRDYRPGLLVFEIGEAVPRPRDLRDAARRHLTTLHEATGHNVGLAMLDGFEVVNVDVFFGADAPRQPQHSGGRTPAHASASGQAILAFADPDLTRAPRRLQRVTPRTITTRTELSTVLDKVRRRGVAFDREESLPSVVSVAAPVRDGDEVAAAVSMAGYAGRIDLGRMEAAVRTTAMAISRDLEAAHSVVRPVLGRR